MNLVSCHGWLINSPIKRYRSSLKHLKFVKGRLKNQFRSVGEGRVRKRHLRMFFRCLTHVALIREKERMLVQNTLLVVFLNASQGKGVCDVAEGGCPKMDQE